MQFFFGGKRLYGSNLKEKKLKLSEKFFGEKIIKNIRKYLENYCKIKEKIFKNYRKFTGLINFDGKYFFQVIIIENENWRENVT